MWFLNAKPRSIPSPTEALPGRPDPIVRPGLHTVLGTPIAGPWPDGTQTAIFGLGCFWGAEKSYWQLPGVISTSAGYAGGSTPNPTYQEACSGRTGHAEAVQVAFDPSRVAYEELLKLFWEHHDPTQGMRQGNGPLRKRHPRLEVPHPHPRQLRRLPGRIPREHSKGPHFS